MDEIDIAAVVAGWDLPWGWPEAGDAVLVEMYADFIEQAGLTTVFNEYARRYDPMAARDRIIERGEK